MFIQFITICNFYSLGSILRICILNKDIPKEMEGISSMDWLIEPSKKMNNADLNLTQVIGWGGFKIQPEPKTDTKKST